MTATCPWCRGGFAAVAPTAWEQGREQERDAGKPRGGGARLGS